MQAQEPFLKQTGGPPDPQRAGYSEAGYSEESAGGQQPRPARTRQSRGQFLAIGAALLLLLAGGALSYSMLQRARTPSPAASHLAEPAPSGPLADPAANQAEPAHAEDAASSAPPAAASADDAAAAAVAAASEAAPEATATAAAAPLADPVPESSLQESPIPAVETETAQLRARMAALQERLSRLEDRPAMPARASAAAMAAARRTAPARAHAAPAPPPVDPAASVRAQLQGQLLALDTWDGRPSALVGTGIPGDRRTRVLQVGDSINGVSLQSVDMAAGRATFSTAGGTVTLDVHEGERP
jgi:hypothetical protein